MLFTRWQERRRLCDAAIVDWSSELLAGCFGVRPGRLRREGKVVMPHNICFVLVVGKINLAVLLFFATSFSLCLNDRVAEFALTKKEDSNLKEQNKKELVEEEEDLDSEDLEVFYPTHQWQIVRPGLCLIYVDKPLKRLVITALNFKEAFENEEIVMPFLFAVQKTKWNQREEYLGQAVPAGLHVQLNLQTGEKLAKIPDNNNEKSNIKDLPKNKRLGHIDIDSSSFTTQELKKALSKMKEHLKTDDTLEEKAHKEDVRQRFRPIEKLKEEFKELNLQLETDFEIMFKLINKLNSSTSTLEEKIAALHDLEYYVHQVDNAKDLHSFGGLQLLINALNSTEPLMKEYASFVLGAALSSNPKVQVAAIEGGALQKLLVILATDQPLPVKKKALFALSSMLRHFPYAQQQFLKLGGLQVLRSLCTEKGMETLHIRIVTLLYDLIVEKLLLKDSHDDDDDDQIQERTQQYSQVNLVPAIVEQGWCTIISNLLMLPEHDTREKVLKTVHVILGFCSDSYKGDHNLNQTLSLLRQEYEELAAEEQKEGDEDGYFKELLSSINSIAQQLK